MPKSSKRTMVAIEFEEAVKESDNATKRRRADGQAGAYARAWIVTSNHMAPIGRQDRQEAKPAAESAKPAAVSVSGVPELDLEGGGADETRGSFGSYCARARQLAWWVVCA